MPTTARGYLGALNYWRNGQQARVPVLSIEWRYALAVLAVLAALALRLLLQPLIGTAPFVTLFPAIVISALLLGGRAALLALGIGVGAAAGFIVPVVADGAIDVEHVYAIATFGALSGLVCLLVMRLQAVSARLHESDVRLAGLLNASHIGIVLTDHNERIIEFNEAYRTLLGYDSTQLRGMSAHDVEVAGATAAAREGVHEGPAEREYRRCDGSRVPVRVNDVSFNGEDGNRQRWTLVEDQSATAAARALDARRQQQLKAISENVLVGIMLAEGRRIAWVNDAFANMVGYTTAELIGQTTQVLHADQAEADEFRDRITPTLMAGDVFRSVVKQTRKDGSGGWYSLSCALVTPGRDERIGIFVDITERRRLETALLDASNRERRALGADLHDGLGQELTGLSMLVGALRASARNGALDERLLDRLEAVAMRAIDTCREVARGLSPSAEEAGGFVGALESMVAQQVDIYAADIRLQLTGDAPLDYAAEALEQLFRITQECLSNACKHAQAATIRVRVHAGDAALRLEVSDDGIGLPVGRAAGEGMGLQIMRHRAATIAARYTIGPGPDGRGTTVACVLPRALPLRGPAPTRSSMQLT